MITIQWRTSRRGGLMLRGPGPFLTHLPECTPSWCPGFFHIHCTALMLVGIGVCVCVRVRLCVSVCACYKPPSISQARSSGVAAIRMTSLPRGSSDGKTRNRPFCHPAPDHVPSSPLRIGLLWSCQTCAVITNEYEREKP